MKRLRIAIATSCLAEPVRQALQTAADFGADGVQLDARNELRPTDLSETGRRQFVHHLETLGLSVASLSFPVRRTYYDQDQLEARIAGTKAAMQFAFQLKARVLTFRMGRLPDDENGTEYRILRDVMNDLARHANHLGVTPAITPTRDTAERLAAFLAGITDGPIGVNFDPAAFLAADDEPVDALRRLHSSILHVQVRDALRDIDGGNREVPVGRGEVAWDELLALLDEADYRGWFSIERTQGDDKRTDIARAVQYLRRVGMG